jgi:hypothetical protein
MPGQIDKREHRDNLTATIRRVRIGETIAESLRRYPVTGAITASDALQEDRAER